MSLHSIGELDRTGVVIRLTAEEQRQLRSVVDRIGVEWDPNNTARVFSLGLVGTIMLSLDTAIEVVTKVPVENVLALASLAYRTVAIPRSFGYTQLADSGPVDWLALLLVSEAEALVARGLRQGYEQRQEALPFVRGRLKFDGTQVLTQPSLIWCEFSDFVLDTRENRLVRGCLELLMTQRVLPGLRLRAANLLRAFHSVSFVHPNSSLVDACRITRLNQHYDPALQLCRLIVDQAGVTSDFGTNKAPAFFFPMERVFQEGITELLRAQFGSVTRQASKAYSSGPDGDHRTLTVIADIVIGAPPRIVIDTKYARGELPNQYGGRSLRNEHVYQAAFYGRGFRCDAALVYPRDDRDLFVSFDFDGGRVTLLSVDLTLPNLAGADPLLQMVAGMTMEANGDAQVTA